MAKLSANVVLQHDGETHALAEGDDAPDWAVGMLGAHVFEGGVHPNDADGDGNPDRASGSEPARAGKGSSRDAWVAFAGEKDVPVDDGDTRDAIIAKLVDAGVIGA